MAIWDDNRAQAIQVGAVLLFAVLVIVFSLYQAFVVPNQNQQVEANHLQTVEGDMQDLRSAMVSVPTSGNGRSVGVTLGTMYPARAIALNPPPSSGHLRTLATADESVNVTIANARAIDRETADYWNGTERTRETGGVVYEPNYNEFRDPPDLVYDSTTLLSRFDDATLWASGQTVFDGRRVTLLALDGDYDRSSSQSISVDLDPVSASTTDVAITNETGENVTVQFASQRNASAWQSLLLEEEQWYNQSGSVVDVRAEETPDSSFDLVTVELAQDRTYTFRMAKVGIGAGVERPDSEYLTDVEGSGKGVPERGEATITVEVRDGFNNPRRGVTVIAGTEQDDAGVSPNKATSDGDGQVTVTYEAPEMSGASPSQLTDRVQFSLDPSLSSAVNSSNVNGSTAENVSVPIRVNNIDGGTGGGTGDQTLQAVESEGVDNGNEGLTFDIENTGSEDVTVDQFSINVTSIQSGVEINDGNDPEFEITDSGATVGSANAPGNGNTFPADGSPQALDNTATISPTEDARRVDIRRFDPNIPALEFADSETDADVTVTLYLTDGPTQKFYFREK